MITSMMWMMMIKTNHFKWFLFFIEEEWVDWTETVKLVFFLERKLFFHALCLWPNHAAPCVFQKQTISFLAAPIAWQGTWMRICAECARVCECGSVVLTLYSMVQFFVPQIWLCILFLVLERLKT